MKSVHQFIGTLLGRIILSLATLIVAAIILHTVWDDYKDPDKVQRFAVWLSEHVILFIALLFTLICGWGTWLALGLLWMKKDK